MVVLKSKIEAEESPSANRQNGGGWPLFDKSLQTHSHILIQFVDIILENWKNPHPLPQLLTSYNHSVYSEKCY